MTSAASGGSLLLARGEVEQNTSSTGFWFEGLLVQFADDNYMGWLSFLISHRENLLLLLLLLLLLMP